MKTTSQRDHENHEDHVGLEDFGEEVARRSHSQGSEVPIIERQDTQTAGIVEGGDTGLMHRQR